MPVIKTQFTLRSSPETNAKIKIIAAKENRSMSNMMDYLIKKEVARFEEEENGELTLTEDLSLK